MMDEIIGNNETKQSTDMNMPQIIATIQKASGLTANASKQVAKALFEKMSECIAAGGKVTLLNIGNLRTISRAPRRGRNPRTGEPLAIATKTAVKFTMSRPMKEKLNSV